MQYRALTTFNSKHGLIRGGSIVTLEDKYAAQLMRARRPMVEPVGLEPTNRQAFEEAPRRKVEDALGNAEGGEDPAAASIEGSSLSQDDGRDASSEEDQQDGGRGRRRSSQRPARRSRKKT